MGIQMGQTGSFEDATAEAQAGQDFPQLPHMVFMDVVDAGYLGRLFIPLHQDFRRG